MERWGDTEQWELSFHKKPPENDAKDVLKDVFKRKGEINNFKNSLKSIIKSHESNIHYWKSHLESKKDKKKTIFQKRLANREITKRQKETKNQYEKAGDGHVKAELDNYEYWKRLKDRREREANTILNMRIEMRRKVKNDYDKHRRPLKELQNGSVVHRRF